ncbi:hypothetical protein KAR48_04985 [bacterium]|nr:hypothetical protein [bacterium]
MHSRPGIVIVILALTTMCCFNPFAPELNNELEGEELIITEQATPEEVLQNFKVAYTFRDSILYSNCIDTGFMFIYFDPEASSSGHEESWGRDDDLRTTGRLFRNFDIIDLLWNATLYAWTRNDEGEICRGFQLHLSGPSSDYKIRGRAVFSFRKSPDGTWRIIQWEDQSEL